MKKRRNRSDSSAWMALPLYIFTIVFVVCPLIYMVALSFATPSRGFGVTWKFTLDNYRNENGAVTISGKLTFKGNIGKVNNGSGALVCGSVADGGSAPDRPARPAPRLS